MAGIYKSAVIEVSKDGQAQGVVLFRAPGLRFDEELERYYPRCEFAWRELEVLNEIAIKATEDDREAYKEAKANG